MHDRDDALTGLNEGSLFVPDEEIIDRISVIPRNVRTVTRCLPGVRGQMAYHNLKDRGYNEDFRNAAISKSRATNVATSLRVGPVARR